MKHKTIIDIYNGYITHGMKLQAVKFVYDITRAGNPKDSNIPGASDNYVGLKESKDLVDISSDGNELLSNIKVKHPKHYKALNFVKYGT